MSGRILTRFCFLLPLALAFAKGPDGEVQTKRQLWNTYMDAAAASLMNNDLVNAEVLWRCAEQVAQDLNDEDRLLVSRTLLYTTAVQSNDQGIAREIRSKSSRPDLRSIDETFAPVSRTLGRIADFYDNNNHKEAQNAADYLAVAERCRLLQEAIATKLLDSKLAEDKALFGLVYRHESQLEKQGGKTQLAAADTANAIEKTTEALDLWQKEDQKRAARTLASNEFSVTCAGSQAGQNAQGLFACSGLAIEDRTDINLLVRVILAMSLLDSGDKTNKTAAEQILKSLLNRSGLNVYPVLTEATAARLLGTMYDGDQEYLSAETYLQKSLDFYLRLEDQGWAASLAKDLATVKLKLHKPAEAAELAQTYHFSLDAQ